MGVELSFFELILFFGLPFAVFGALSLIERLKEKEENGSK